MCRFQKYNKNFFFEHIYSTEPAPMVMGPPKGAPMTIGAGSMGMELPGGTVTKLVPTHNYGVSGVVAIGKQQVE